MWHTWRWLLLTVWALRSAAASQRIEAFLASHSHAQSVVAAHGALAPEVVCLSSSVHGKMEKQALGRNMVTLRPRAEVDARRHFIREGIPIIASNTASIPPMVT